MNRNKLHPIQARLMKIEDRDGRLTPESVVRDARNPKSPLHGEFEWNDNKASEAYRLLQARRLIRVRVEYQLVTHTIRASAFIRDPTAAPREQGYRSVIKLRGERDHAIAALRSEAERAAAHLQRTRDLALALDIESELDSILEEFSTFRMTALA